MKTTAQMRGTTQDVERRLRVLMAITERARTQYGADSPAARALMSEHERLQAALARGR